MGCSLLRWTAVGFRVGEAVAVLLCTCLYGVASRDTLNKYYARVAGVLGTSLMIPTDEQTGKDQKAA
ncbi:MAG: hypothetical protein R3B91_16330 [Planctomycetaceae bacterium]